MEILIPTVSVAILLSLTALIARPERESDKFITISTVIIKRIIPIRKVLLLWIFKIPWEPFTIMSSDLTPFSIRSVVLFSEKWKPLLSNATIIVPKIPFIISPKASVTIAR